ncbi:MAG: hypothetical protein PHR00_00295 [Patescibacteria group bacterium]|nr:hypothetical protein [Patescibacteria group bacterium]
MEFLYFCLAALTIFLAIFICLVVADIIKILIIKHKITRADSKYYLLSVGYVQYFVILSDAIDIGVCFKSKSFYGDKFFLFFDKTSRYVVNFAKKRKIEITACDISDHSMERIIHYKDQD